MSKVRYIRYDEKNNSQIIRRHITYPMATGCHTCGGFNGFGGLFEFGVIAGGMRENQAYWIGQFCSIGCFDNRRKGVYNEL